jgi:hypothetical protein
MRNVQEAERQNLAASGQVADEKPLVGTLIVKLCDTMPFGSFYQVGNRIMVYGIFTPRDSWVQGPLVHVYPGGEQWNVLADNWKLAWLPQAPPVDDDLIDGSPEDFNTENEFKDKPLHHYHLTQDSCGDCVWTYKVLTFRRELGRLVADSPIVANRDGDLSPYRFELSAHGKYVVLISSKVGVDPDVGVELLPGSEHFGEGVFQLYGARIIATFNHRKPVTTISILSKDSLTPGATPGFLDQRSADELQKRWDVNAIIGRLPTDCQTLTPKKEIMNEHA